MQELAEQIAKTFPLETRAIQKLETEEDLLILLSKYIQELIDTDFAKLVNTLYRIDVSEAKIKRALDVSSPKDANTVIAALIIEREKQKAITRQEYRKRNL